MLIYFLTRTPLYVWAIFVYLLFVGYQSTKPKTIWIPFLFTVPVILTISKIIFSHDNNTAIIILSCLIGLSIGTFFAIKQKNIQFILEKNSIHLPGSYTTLILLLTLFACKYTLGALKEINPDLYHSHSYIDTIITFLFAGYSLGKAITYTVCFLYKKYR